MRILIIQLARFGDILQTIPVVRAIKRNHPTAEIDLVVRTKYASVLDVFPGLCNVICFDTEKVFAPVFSDVDYNEEQFSASVSELESFCDDLRKHDYEKILNYSYSPFSSYMTKYISEGKEVEIKGYSRFDDGFLNIVDDTSAYFYSQVGVGRHNRFHLIDLFASTANVDLEKDDYLYEAGPASLQIEGQYAVLHLGASSNNKRVPTTKWHLIMKKIIETGTKPVLIGSKSELPIVEEACMGLEPTDYVNLLGKTTFQDLFSIINEASMYLGGDSGPLHICNFTNIPCFNLSNKEVNFWETGPKSDRSYVWYEDNFNVLDVDLFFSELQNTMNGRDSLFIKGDKWSSFVGTSKTFEWQLILALYTGADFPVCEDPNTIKALVQVNEVNEIALHQLNNYLKSRTIQSDIINMSDQIMEEISVECPLVKPLVSWFLAEKIRVGPGATDEVVQSYKELHFKFSRILSIYVGGDWTAQEEKHGFIETK